MSVNLPKIKRANKKKELRNQDDYSIRIKLRALIRFFRDPSTIVTIFFVIISGLLIALPYLNSHGGKNAEEWINICQNVGFDLLVCL